MSLVSQLLVAVTISSMTSTLLLVAWRLLRCFFMAVNPKMVNVALRIVCVTYFLPIGYIAILLTDHHWMKGLGSAGKLYFARTKYITGLIRVVAIVWFIIAFFRILRCCSYNKKWCRKLKDNIPINGELAAKVFNKVCKELDIPGGKVTLQRNPLMKSPMIVHVFHPQVLLPEQDYTEKELELIFYHELSHFKHHDLKWKTIVVIITMLQGFNPFVYPLISIIGFWAECMADISALEETGNIQNMKWYFEKIESLMPEPIERKKKDKYLFAALYRSDNSMVRRIEIVEYYRYAHICSKQMTAGLLTAFLFASIMFVAEVGICIVDLHKFVYRVTENISKIQILADGTTEHHVDGEGWIRNPKLIKMNLMSDQEVDSKRLNFLHCEVEPNICQATCSFYAKAGQRVDVSVGVRLIEVDYKIGILSEDRGACYVQAQGSISHNFSIEKDGKYRVFVKNNRDEAISYMLINYKLLDSE